jgi:sodium-dependent phosphate cotransporter
VARGALLLLLLYAFLLCIALLSSSLKLLGSDFSEALLQTTSSPVVGLMVGMLSTAVIQSSSTTTSIVVSLVAGGGLSIRGAVPIIMGANMGTTVTNTLVALTAVNRREEFRRSFAGATIHDFFNLLAVLVLMPLEQTFHFLEKGAFYLADRIAGPGGAEFESPIKLVTQPVVHAFLDVVDKTGWSEPVIGIVALVVALGGLFLALSRLPTLMKELFLSRTEGTFFRSLSRGGMAGILVGLMMTVLVQSSSITTSLLVPMVGAGIVPLEGALAVTLGANVGTTVTALLASAAGNHDGVVIALVHLLFNLSGILLIYPFRPIRRIPIVLAQRLADLSMRSRAVPFLYLIGIFFLLPGFILLVQRLTAGH